MTVASTTRQQLSIDGRRLAYVASGPPGSEYPPVLLLHGWGGSLDAMQSVQRGLDPALYVISLDLPGFGQSDLPPPSWGSPEYAEVVRQVLELLDLDRVSLVGHSFGGKISIQLAARWPELVHRLVLVDSAGIKRRRSPAYYLRVAAYKLARRAGEDGLLARILAKRLGSVDYRAAGQLRPVFVRVVNEDLRPLLPRVQAPTLLVWGDQDRDTPLASGRLMERLLPDAGLVVFPGAGHYAYADDLGRFCRVAGHFLKE